MGRRFLASVAAAAGALLAVACSGAAVPAVKPLASLGHLRPAPYPGDPGPELVPIPNAPALAPPGSTARENRSVDGIRCQFNARVVFHIHVHLTVFVNGRPRALPAGIGIWPPLGPQNYRNGQFGITGGNCFSWLSTHYEDGIIHTESPVQRTFVLGEFFDLWGQPLSRHRVGPAKGAVTAIVDRKVWTGDPRAIPLHRHAQIQLEVGRPLVAPQSIQFPGGF
jgi:hypothetical protein